MQICRTKQAEVWSYLGYEKIQSFLAALFGICLLGLAAGCSLSLGIWPVKELIRGPFHVAEGGRAIFQPLARPPFPGLSSASDTNASPWRSRLKAWLNGIPLSPPHTLHADIASKGAGSFSHWGNTLIFSFPPGLENNKQAVLEIRYYWSISDITWNFLVLGAILSFAALLFQACQAGAAWPLSLKRYIFLFLGCLSLATCLPLSAFLLIICSQLFAGESQQLAEIWRVTGDRLLVAAAQSPQGLIWLGGLVYFLSLIVPSAGKADRPTGTKQARLFQTAGLLFLWVWLPAMLFLSTARVWAGLLSPADAIGNLLGGSIPWNDAAGHYWGPFQQVWTGNFPDFNMRRPLATCAKSVLTLLGGFQPSRQIVLQVALLATVLSLAVYKVFLWRGTAAALFFAGISLNILLPYGPTHLTEPLGLFWALCAVPAVLAGLRPKAFGARFLALFFISLSSATRMGNIFLPPCYALWVLYMGAREKENRMKAFASIGMAFLIVLAVNLMAKNLFGSRSGSQVGSNFAYVLTGLSHGATWNKALELYGKELELLDSEAKISNFLYKKALAQIRHHPSTFLLRLAEGTWYFIKNSISMLLNSQRTPADQLNTLDLMGILILLIGVTRTLFFQWDKCENLLWITMVASTAGSAAFVIFDDGWRVLSASYIFCGLSVAAFLGFSGPERADPRTKPLFQLRFAHCLALALVCAASIISAPLLAAAFYKADWGTQRPTRGQLDAQGVPSPEIIPGFKFSPTILTDSQNRESKFPAITVRPEFLEATFRNTAFSQYQLIPQSINLRDGFGVFLTPLGRTVFVRSSLIQAKDFKSRWILIKYDPLSELKGPYFFEAANLIPFN